MKKNLLTILGVISLAVFVSIALPNNANAQEAKKSADQTITTTNTTSNDTSTNDSYKYKAQAGDSYSVLARKAIQTYGIDSKTNLSGAQIVFAETNITNAASSPSLALHQEVAINKNTVKAWVDKAKQLTPAQQAAWNYYVPFVDFNTNKNGQS